MTPKANAAWSDPACLFAPEHAGPGLFLARTEVPEPEDHAGEKPAILVVEDDYLIATEVEAALSEAGFAVAGLAASADEAIEIATARRPALAIMDMRLSGERDGIDTALELFRSHGIRCIFATAHSDRDVLRRAEPACPFGWLQKPYTVSSLVGAVQEALQELAGERR